MPSSFSNSKFSIINPLTEEWASKILTIGFDFINLLKFFNLISGVIPTFFVLSNNLFGLIPVV